MSSWKCGWSLGATVALVLLAVSSPIQAGAQVSAPLAVAHGSSLQRGFINISGTPGVPAVNPDTHTLYVPIQCVTGCPALPMTHSMDVVNTATCNATVTSDCRVIATAKVAGGPLAAAVDERTDTIYTANAFGTVSVVDGATCNATDTSGCSTPLATIRTGGMDVDDAFNPVTRTLYVANLGGSVFVIDGATCNATTTAGCGRPVKEVQDARDPQALDIDQSTDTIYTTDGGGTGDTVTVIDGATCNGSVGSGCGLTPPTVTVGNGAFWDAVDQRTDTIYVANNNSDTVSVINGARCNAEVTAGCNSIPPAVPVGANPQWVAVDDSLHTVFALNQGDDTLSAIDTRTCDGRMTKGCTLAPPSAQAGSNHDPGYTGLPNTMTLLPNTDTAYVVNVGGANRVSVITLAPCNAMNAAGCRHPAPSAPASDFFVSVDAMTNTIYASNLNLPEIDVINGATCNVKRLTGCSPVAEIPMKSQQSNLGFIEDATHTLYTGDESGSLAIIDLASCNARHTAGCSRAVKARIPVGAFPGVPALNPATRTIYLVSGDKANRIAVVNVAACNAEVTVGCAQTPGVIKIAGTILSVAVSAKTDTIYAPIVSGDTVDVFNGARCNGTNHSGCGHLAATAIVGLNPFAVAVNDATNSVYVSNNDNDGFGPGTLSVINSATCNGTDASGCTGNIPTVDVGRGPQFVTVDTGTDTVYVGDFRSDGVSVLDGATCNAEVTRGCGRPAPEQPVGLLPIGVAVNQATNTVYTMNLGPPPSMSIFVGRG
jgi:DNA-binding beta-propeller fold protein YncE